MGQLAITAARQPVAHCIDVHGIDRMGHHHAIGAQTQRDLVPALEALGETTAHLTPHFGIRGRLE